MSESLRNDGRVWVPKQLDDTRSPDQIPEDDRDYFLERRYPAFGNLVAARRRVARDQARGRRGPRRRAAEERRVPRLRRRRSSGSARTSIEERYGNLFEMYERITDEDPYKVPMRIYPAVHYTMGGLWVDYNLMSNVPGLFVLGEANFSDHGANRLGAIGADAGPRRRLLRAPVHDRRLPRAAARRRSRCRPTTPRSRRPRARSTTRRKRLLSINGNALGRPLPPRARQDHVGQLRHGAQPSRASRRRSPRSPRSARSSARTCACSARTRRSTSRSRRPAASPTSSSSASCSCLDALHRERVVRRPLPRGAPDRGRRGAPRRRALRVRRRVGVQGRRRRARRSTRSRSSSSTSTSPSAATSSTRSGRACTTPWTSRSRVWRQAGPDAPGRVRDLRRPGRQPRHVVPRDARRASTSGSSPTARSRSPSTTTAARASAARAR